MTVEGLSSDDQQTLNGLMEQLQAKRRRNELRSGFMDAKHLLRQLPPTVPDYVRSLGICLGWPAKAVDHLARRAKLDGFSIPGDDLSRWGIDRLVDGNEYVLESRIHHVASLEHGPAFLVSTLGGPGEPDALITRRSALDGTGTWNNRARALDAFLSVSEWQDGKPSEFALYLAGRTISVADGKVQDVATHALPRVPVEPLVYRARDGRPFGSSRITRPIMSITKSAIRTIMRSEGTADFYSAPIIALLGADEATFGGSPRLQMLMSAMFGVPDDDEAASGKERVDLKQISQASQEPHFKQLEGWAQLFAAEASIPVSSLGIGAAQANPTSAESYLASREDLIDEAEAAADGWQRAHVRTMQNAWMLAAGESQVPSELLRLQADFRDPRHPSKASEADWLTKVASMMPWVAEADTTLDLIGVRPAVAERLRADRAAMRARDTLGRLGAEPQEQSMDEAADMRTRLEALGIGIRAGVDPAEAPALVGLPGVKITRTPASVREDEERGNAR